MKIARQLVLALLLCWAAVAVADVAVPLLTARVTDLTGTLSAAEVTSLDQKLADFEARKGSQIAVLMVPTTQPEDIAQYSIRVVEQWKLGRKGVDDGVLLLVAKDDHRLRIEVGYGLEGVLPDAVANRIINEIITPKFKQGDFDGGIDDGVARIIKVIDGEPLPAPKPRNDVSQGSWDDIGQAFPVFLVMTIVIGGILRQVFGRFSGSLLTGGGVAVVAWLFMAIWVLAFFAGIIALFFTLIGDAMFLSGGGGFGGGRGGSSWGSGSGGGGFSGGGGSFGGGGASGSW